jgi:hypothetical protein
MVTVASLTWQIYPGVLVDAQAAIAGPILTFDSAYVKLLRP